MILTDDEVEQRLNSPDNLINKIKDRLASTLVVERMPTKGKTEGSANVPPLVRQLIGGLSVISDEKQKDVAAEFNLSQFAISTYRKGLIGGQVIDEELKEIVEKQEEKNEAKAHEKALDCLVDMLDTIKPRIKTEDVKLKELGKMSADMARVVQALKGSEKEEKTAKTQVVVMTVNQKTENYYESQAV